MEPGGYFRSPGSSTKWEKRGVATTVPVWLADECT